MRTLRILMCVVGVAVLSNMISAGDWMVVQADENAATARSVLSDGTNAYAYLGQSGEFSMLKDGKPTPVTSGGTSFRLHRWHHRLVAGSLVGPNQEDYDNFDQSSFSGALFVLQGATATKITVDGAELVGKDSGLVVADAADCPYFGLTGGNQSGVYKLEGTTASRIGSLELTNNGMSSDHIGWTGSRLLVTHQFGVHVLDGTEFKQVTDSSGENLRFGSALVVGGDVFAGGTAYVLDGTTAVPVELGKDNKLLSCTHFNGTAILCVESAGSKVELMEVKKGKATKWKAAKKAEGIDQNSLTVIGATALLQTYDGKKYAWYRIDGDGTKELSIPKEYERASLGMDSARGSSLAITLKTSATSGFAALVDNKGKLELCTGAGKEPIAGDKISTAFGDDGLYVCSELDLQSSSQIPLCFLPLK